MSDKQITWKRLGRQQWLVYIETDEDMRWRAYLEACATAQAAKVADIAGAQQAQTLTSPLFGELASNPLVQGLWGLFGAG